MTTRFKPDDLTEGLTGAIHETGHALYEQGRNLKLDGLPINEVSVLPYFPIFITLRGCARRLAITLDKSTLACL